MKEAEADQELANLHNKDAEEWAEVLRSTVRSNAIAGFTYFKTM